MKYTVSVWKIFSICHLVVDKAWMTETNAARLCHWQWTQDCHDFIPPLFSPPLQAVMLFKLWWIWRSPVISTKLSINLKWTDKVIWAMLESTKLRKQYKLEENFLLTLSSLQLFFNRFFYFLFLFYAHICVWLSTTTTCPLWMFPLFTISISYLVWGMDKYPPPPAFIILNFFLLVFFHISYPC